MRTSTVRKMEYSQVKTVSKAAEIFDFDRLGQIQAATKAEIQNRSTVATESVDFEEFMNKYSMKTAGFFE